MAVYYYIVLYNQIFIHSSEKILSIYTDSPYAYAILHTHPHTYRATWKEIDIHPYCRE